MSNIINPIPFINGQRFRFFRLEPNLRLWLNGFSSQKEPESGFFGKAS